MGTVTSTTYSVERFVQEIRVSNDLAPVLQITTPDGERSISLVFPDDKLSDAEAVIDQLIAKLEELRSMVLLQITVETVRE